VISSFTMIRFKDENLKQITSGVVIAGLLIEILVLGDRIYYNKSDPLYLFRDVI
jgi:hypothetical protein